MPRVIKITPDVVTGEGDAVMVPEADATLSDTMELLVGWLREAPVDTEVVIKVQDMEFDEIVRLVGAEQVGEYV